MAVLAWKTAGHPRAIEFPASLCQEILEQSDASRPPPGSPGRQRGGVLLGVRTSRGLRILSARRLDCEHAYGPPFELSPGDEGRLRLLIEEVSAAGRQTRIGPVGWYLTKERWSVLTHQDRAVYDRHFPRPWQVTLVVVPEDTGRCLAGFFYRLKDGSIWVTRGEFRVTPPAGDSEAEGRGEEESEATGPPPGADPEACGKAPDEAADARPGRDAAACGAAEEPSEAEANQAEERAPPEAAGRQREGAVFAVWPSQRPGHETRPLPPYCAFFGLKAAPFAGSGTWWGRQQQRVLAELLRNIRMRSGLAVLTGKAGTGKTTLLLRLADRLARESIEFGLLLNPGPGIPQFYESVAHDLYLSCVEPSKERVLPALSGFLQERARRGSITALLIDNAQELDQEVLEEIRLLDELRGGPRRLLQVVLCGAPGLDARLAEDDRGWPGLRVATFLCMRPLARDETAIYIADRMAEAGADYGAVFPQNVLTEIHRRSGGILYAINVLSGRLLERCYAAGVKTATLEFVDSASAQLAGPRPEVELVSSLERAV